MNQLRYPEEVEKLRRLSNIPYRKNFSEYQSLLKMQRLMEEYKETLEGIDCETLMELMGKVDAQITIKQKDLDALASIDDFF